MDDQSTDNSTPDEDGELATQVTELTTRVDKIDERLSTVEQSIAKQTKSIDGLSVRLSRPAVQVKSNDEQTSLEVKSFESYLRRGTEHMPTVETKNLRISDDTSGGYLTPERFSREIVKNLVEFSPIRRVARVIPISAGSVLVPKRTGEPTAAWVTETGARAETQSTYGQARITVHEIGCYIDVSRQLLEDAAFDVAAEVSADIAEEFGQVEGLAFVSGSGTNQPQGFMNNDDVSSVNSGSATAITADGLIDLMHALPQVYAQNGTWVMNRTTLASLRKLKNVSGDYLIQAAGLANAPVDTLLGRPILEAPNMPGIAGGAFPIAFGDFRRAFRIYDRISVSILRDPYTQAANGLTRFHARRRVGAGVVKAEALRKLKVAA